MKLELSLYKYIIICIVLINNAPYKLKPRMFISLVEFGVYMNDKNYITIAIYLDLIFFVIFG